MEMEKNLDGSGLMSIYKIDLISNWTGFVKLEKEWNSLLDRSGEKSIFLTWEWSNAWYMSKQRYDIVPWIITVRKAKRLVGIAPLYLARLDLFKTVRYRTLRFVGDVDAGAEYASIVAQKEEAVELKSAIFQFLALKNELWDCLWMPNVAGWTSSFNSLFKSLDQQSELCWAKRIRGFSAIPLPQKWETYLDSISPNLKKSVRKTGNRMKREISFKIKLCQSEDELEYFLETLFSLHGKRWAMRGELGSFVRGPDLEKFYRFFTPVALTRGWLRMYIIEVKGSAQAIQIGYSYNGVFYALQEGFNPEFNRGVGKGISNFLRAKVVQSCIEEGISEYDFLGGVTPHKLRWEARERQGYDFFIWNRNLRNSVFRLMNFWPTGKYLTSG